MGTRVTDLRCKEVINVTDGLRLGFVSDVEILLPEGKVLALVVPGHPAHRLRYHPGGAGAGQMPRAPAQAGLVLKEAAGGAWMINRPGFGRSPPTGARRPGKPMGPMERRPHRCQPK